MTDPTTGMDAVTVHLRRQAANVARQHPRCATCEHWGSLVCPFGIHDDPDWYCHDHTEVQP